MFCLPTVVISIVCYSLCCMEPIDDELADEFDEDEDEDGFPIQRSSDDLPPGNIMSQVPVHWWDSFYISLPLRGRHIESNTGKSARQGNLRHPRVRFQSFADEARGVRERLKSYTRVSEISLSCTFCRCLILFLSFISCF
jgi:hypothetical protein